MRLRPILVALTICAVVALTAGIPWPGPEPASAADVQMVVGGGYHTCALTGAGGVQCWGLNNTGQLGNDTTSGFLPNDTPVDVCAAPGCGSNLSGVTYIAAGEEYTCAVVAGGVKCWGDNSYGQLGDGTTTQRSAPVDVCATGASAPCGSNLLTGVVTVEVGSWHSCARMSDGGVKCWGDNAAGQLGDNNAPTDSTTPVDVCADSDCLSDLTGATGVTTGSSHSCALMAGGGAKCWGENGAGQLGDENSPTDSDTPVDVCAVGSCKAGNLAGVTWVWTGGLHTCAIIAGPRNVVCWGFNNNGQLGDNSLCGVSCDTPVNVCADASCTGNLSGALLVGGGPQSQHTCAVMTGGGAKCWGFNAAGQLGDGNAPTNSDTPVDVCAEAGCSEPASDVISGGVGDLHSCGVTTWGGIRCAGSNNYGQLGDGNAPIASDTRTNVSGLGPKWMLYVVDSTGDGGDSGWGDLVCNDGSGNCTLRAAIEEANADGIDSTIAFNIAGTGPHTIQPASELPAITNPVVIDGETEPDFAGTPVVEVDGVDAGFSAGLGITAGSSVVRGLAIYRFDGDGLNIGTNGGNVVEGNVIGTDASGTIGLGNTQNGVMVHTPGNTIGGTAAGAHNVISGNGTNGIMLQDSGTTGNQVLGNYIGTDVTGATGMANGGAGVGIGSGASNNTIGGTVGTTPGGPCTGACNVISGNESGGVVIDGDTTSGNQVQGNYIGIDVTGSAGLANTGDGVFIANNASGNTVGGTTPGARNVISGNEASGVYIYGSDTGGNVVQGNYIGTDASGTADSGNATHGVVITDAPGNTIGGTESGEGNTIAYNVANGVAIGGATATVNVVRGNSIHSNGGLGIDLALNGVTANDEDDPDSGPNNLQNFPVLTSAIPGSITIEGTLNSTGSTILALDFYASASCDGSGYGEGKTYLGSTVVVTDGGGDVTFSVTLPASVSVGQFITATATDPSGNTSEFSACFQASVPVNTRVGQPDTPGDCPDGTPTSNPACLTNQPSGLHQAPTAGAAGLGEAASGSTDGLYYADTGNNMVKKIENVLGTDTVFDVAGKGTFPVTSCSGGPPENNLGDGCKAKEEAVLDSPRDVYVDSAGKNLYIADADHCLVRKVDLSTENPIITTVAGTYPGSVSCGLNGDGGAATSAQLYSPRGVYVDSAGENLYIADSVNCAIRKVDLNTNIITTVAGTLGVCGDSGDAGPATAAKLRNPHDVYGLLPSEDLVIADSGNHRVRRLDLPSGNIYPFAGTGTQGDSLGDPDGDGVGVATNAQFDFPEALTAADHKVFVADTKNDRILKVDALMNTIMVAVADCPCPPGAVDLDQPKGVTIASDRRSIDISNTEAAIIVTAGISPTGEQSHGFVPTTSCGNLPGVSTIDWGLPALLLGLILVRKRIGALFIRLWSAAGLAWRRRTDSVPP